MNLRELTKKINIKGRLFFDEPMEKHTTFRIGGPADLFCIPEDIEDLKVFFSFCMEEDIPYFTLGAGANILVSDMGIRGAVIDLSLLNGIKFDGTYLSVSAGTLISEASRYAEEKSLTGMEFIYSMPGSTGGSLWMNARCYGRSVSDILDSAEILTENLTVRKYQAKREDFGYKVSPFRKMKGIIINASFRLSQGTKKEISEKMAQIKVDREKKGHFLFPSAGSVFKNNRDFGMPAGKIIEKTGLRGFTIGGAKVSDYHANIIVNTGGARASDVLRLIELVENRVFKQFGFKLEREILLAGQWQHGDRRF
ncbi:MAG: UDP-N-acetylmuramate dehydrogenase [Spirochaetes bacterium]|nr:UDP-N-acetylmuramate dehydrogenase [Spirochaetota bacterium]